MEKMQVGQPYHRTAMYVKDIQKRVFDCIVTLFLLLLLSPILLFCLLIHFIYGEKSLFTKRLYGGRNNQPIVIIKSKSLMDNKWKTRCVNELDDQGIYTKRRIQTDRLLKQMKFEEILLLLSVLKGDMSLIGPRAEVVEITQQYPYYQSQRLFVKPGLTGYAQVHNDVIESYSQMIEYDLYYIQHRSMRLDSKIMIKAIKHLIQGKAF